jgi:putative hydrolase of the HAD superfamily
LSGRTRPAIRNVVFDLGGVLVDWRPQALIDAFYADAELRAALRREAFQHADWVDFDRGALDEAVVGARIAARLGRPQLELAQLFERVREMLQPLPDAVEIVRGLRARGGLSLYVLSNMAESIFRHIEKRTDLFTLFDGIVISGAISLVKPEPAIFEHLAQRFAIAPRETVFVDDLPANVAAARELGFVAIRFESVEQCRRELGEILG